MTDIVCKCGNSMLEEIQCAVCGEYFKAVWIPVSESYENLPVNDVLVVTHNKNVYFSMGFHDGSWRDFEGDYLLGVTHWMPLPPPPQETE